MSAQQVHDFGVVDEKGDVFEFAIEQANTRDCRFVAVVQTERGPRRTEVATVPTELWNLVATAAVKELVSEMREGEREKKAPTLRAGLNRLSPLVGRELGVLLIALMEEGAPERFDALLHAWRELAREERWWLYSKAAAPGQRLGAGWRRALFHALSETSETRSAPVNEIQKKSSGSTRKRSSQKPGTKTIPRSLRVTNRFATQSNPQQPKISGKTADVNARVRNRRKTTVR